MKVTQIKPKKTIEKIKNLVLGRKIIMYETSEPGEYYKLLKLAYPHEEGKRLIDQRAYRTFKHERAHARTAEDIGYKNITYKYIRITDRFNRSIPENNFSPAKISIPGSKTIEDALKISLATKNPGNTDLEKVKQYLKYLTPSVQNYAPVN